MNKTIIPFEEFEKAVMQKLFEKENTINIVLREQYRTALIVSRTFSGAGFFTDLKVPEGTARVTEPVEYSYGNVVASINNSTVDFGFVLFIENGTMTCLEGYTWMDSWPEAIYSYKLYDNYETSEEKT